MSNGDLKIIAPADEMAEVGDRFSVLNEHGEPIAVIKVVRSDSAGTIARFFQPFTSDQTLSAAIAGVSAGAAIGTSILPAVGSIVGAAVGALTAAILRSALSRKPPLQPIKSGMAIAPIVGRNQDHGSSTEPGEFPSQ